MKVFVEDSMDTRAPKAKEERKSKASSTRRSSRSSGFKRRKPAEDLDALIASGPNEEEAPAVAEADPVEFPASDEPIGMELGGASDEVIAEGVEMPNVSEDEVDFAPPPLRVPEETLEQSDGAALHKPARRAPVIESAPDDTQEEADEEEPPAPTRKESRASKFVKPDKRTKASKANKLTKEPKAKKAGKREEKKAAFTVSPPKETKPKKSPKQKPAKSPKPLKKSAMEDNFAPNHNPVVQVPESVGSQIVTLLEVIVGAVLMFVGATQVGNILINNIVQGMLGG